MLESHWLAPAKYATTEHQLVYRSPFFIEVEDPNRDLIDPAVKGTENVLQSVVKHKKTVRRTVVTSSVAGQHMCLLAYMF